MDMLAVSVKSASENDRQLKQVLSGFCNGYKDSSKLLCTSDFEQ